MTSRGPSGQRSETAEVKAITAATVENALSAVIPIGRWS